MDKKVFLVAEEQDQDKLFEVLGVLNSIKGKFYSFEIYSKRRKKYSIIEIEDENKLQSSENLLKAIKDHRDSLDIGDQNHLLFLTSRKIKGNFFNGIDFKSNNIFVDINNWEYIFMKDTSDKYPIAYMAWISLMINVYFPDEKAAQAALHTPVDKGCIMDFNADKTKVDLKILTARICPQCLETYLNNIKDKNLLGFFRGGLEKIRSEIVNKEYYKVVKPEPIKVILQRPIMRSYEIYFEGIGTLDLDPLSMTIYLNYLRRIGNGIDPELMHEDYEFLLSLYLTLKGKINESEEKDIGKSKSIIANLCNIISCGREFRAKPRKSHNYTRLNGTIENLLGDFGLEEFYIIKIRDNNAYSLSPDITFEDKTGLIKKIERKTRVKKIKLIDEKKK